MTRPVLHTARLRLEPLSSEHAPALVAMNADAEVMRFVTGAPVPAEDTVASMAAWVTDQDGLGFWAGFVGDEFVGVWCLCRDHERPGVAELAYRLPRSAWGRGLATEGARALVAHAFDVAGLEQVTADTMTAHAASRNVLERLGLALDSTRPGEAPVVGWEDGEVVYGIDRTAWAARAAASVWDAEAADFDLAADHGLTDPAVRAAWRAVLIDALPPAPARVADLGCGTGTLSLLLTDEGYDVEGVDVSPAMIDRAVVKRGDRRAPSFAVGDASRPPLTGPFDVVLCRHVLWALADQVEVLRRWSRLLGPAGRLVLVEGRWSTGAGLTAAETLALLARAGRPGVVRPLPEPTLWGREITDERYLVTA